ncbi:MAG: glycoside hydrolase family 32 protein [Clostridia bacterium]|nr:glycoside hydrolase family 32 protein [Clostridia bacterium]
MKIKIRKKYLIFPVNTLSSYKKMTIALGEETRYTLNIRLDHFSPNFYAYIDVSQYTGKTITVSVDPKMEFSFSESDIMDIPSLYKESYRPQVHFTAKNGWINDPNGLIYFDGKYHMFYQYNPCENKWNNMHWGHAVSTDMLHWEETDVALFPDKTGAMFSGCAIVDEKNLLGVQKGDTPTVLLYYTATTPFSQYLAYSTDALKTIRKYSDSPIIPHIVGSNRDPKVVFCEEWNAYAMALYLEEDIYGIFRSDDLLRWELVQKLSLSSDNECPDLFPINADNGNRKWVFIGARDRYLIGEMKDGGFFPIQEAQSLHYGESAYAGQTFSGMPNGRVVRIDWEKWRISPPNIRGQMSFPAELTLKEIDGVYYIHALPIKEIESLYDKNEWMENITVLRDIPKRISLDRAPYMIKMNIEPAVSTQLALKIFGIDILFDKMENRVKLSDKSAPVTLTSNIWEIVLIVDRCSVELYLDGGKIYLGTVDEKTYCDYNLPYLEMISTTDCAIKTVEMHSLKSIWGD